MGEIFSQKEKLKSFFILSSTKQRLILSELYRKLFRNFVYFFKDKKGISNLMEYCEDLAFKIPGYGFKKKNYE